MSDEMYSFLTGYAVVGGLLVLFEVPTVIVWLLTPVVAYLWREF